MADSQNGGVGLEFEWDNNKAASNLEKHRVSFMVILDPDVAKVFTTSAVVNAVRRALIATMPKTA